MTEEQWAVLSSLVTDRMKDFTRPFVTPLVYAPPEAAPVFGSGSYIDLSRRADDGATKRLLTCEHVARYQPMQHRPYAAGALDPVVGLLCADRAAKLDVATMTITEAAWARRPHAAQALPLSLFASSHAPVDREMFFFRGLAGENAYLSIDDILLDIMSGFGGQEHPGGGDADIFEIEWNPAGTQLTSGTHPDAAKRVKYDDPGGFSGSVVWNTRFVELGCNIQTWTPYEARVTGLLRRWDQKTGTLLVWRVEHLQAWLGTMPNWA